MDLNKKFGDMKLKSDRVADWKHVYNMTHNRRGKFLIINNKTFRRGLDLEYRDGSDVDADRLEILFNKLGFEVNRKDDQTVDMMQKLLIAVSRENHSDADCFAMAILSHGTGGLVFGTDGPVLIDNLVQPLKGNGCASLVGKPKLVFIQACRGGELDEGVELLCEDGDDDAKPDNNSYRIPVEADFLYAYATPPGHFSFRNKEKGAWFIQAITQVFDEHAFQLEINHLMVRVNRVVAYDFVSATRKRELNNKKQAPSFVSMLTKELYFTLK